MSKIAATFIRHLDKGRGEQRLYKLSKPIDWEAATMKDAAKSTEYVVVSAVDAMYTGPETYIFPADEDGNVLEYGELNGSFRGARDCDQAIRNAGWELSEPLVEEATAAARRVRKAKKTAKKTKRAKRVTKRVITKRAPHKGCR